MAKHSVPSEKKAIIKPKHHKVHHNKSVTFGGAISKDGPVERLCHERAVKQGIKHVTDQICAIYVHSSRIPRKKRVHSES